jgi:hypothetical protein
MKINVVQGKFVDDFTFESISNFISKLFSKSLLQFEFHSTDYFTLNNFEEGEFRDEILKKIKLEEEIVNSGTGQTFDYLFNEIGKERRILNINPSELAIYLTGEKNERNFLGWIDEEMKNCFINTTIWKHIYDNEVNIIYPISYEIIGWSLRTLMFKNPKELIENVHFEKTTCLMSYCEDVRDHEIKTMTASICPTCSEILASKNVNKLILNDVKNSFEDIRRFIWNRENQSHYPTIQIKNTNGKIQFFIPDYGDIIIPMEPRYITLYWFFLKKNLGIKLSDLKKYRDEFVALHTVVNNSRFSKEKMIESIEKLIGLSTDPVYNGKGEISVVKSKINSAIKKIIITNINQEYIISGEKMAPNKVLLDRKYFKDLN